MASQGRPNSLTLGEAAALSEGPRSHPRLRCSPTFPAGSCCRGGLDPGPGVSSPSGLSQSVLSCEKTLGLCKPDIRLFSECARMRGRAGLELRGGPARPCVLRTRSWACPGCSGQVRCPSAAGLKARGRSHGARLGITGHCIAGHRIAGHRITARLLGCRVT